MFEAQDDSILPAIAWMKQHTDPTGTDIQIAEDDNTYLTCMAEIVWNDSIAGQKLIDDYAIPALRTWLPKLKALDLG